MTHDECRDSLSAWLDGALTPEESTSVSEHIVACRECRTLSDEMRALSASLRALPRHGLPGDLKAIVLEGATAPSSGSWMFRPWALASAAVLTAVVVIGVVGLRRPETQQVARLDAPADAAGVDLEQAPQESASKEAFSAPASPAPERRSADRFSPVPPTAPEDKPGSLDDRVSALGSTVDEEKQDRNEAQQAPDLKKTAAALEGAEPQSTLVASALTYVARLLVDEQGTFRLEPVEPPAAGGQKDAEADAADGAARNREKSAMAGVTSGSTGATSGAAAEGPPATAREGERAPAAARDARAAQGKLEVGDANQMIFLVQLDAEGTITSAQLVGARTSATEVVEAARTLLIGTRYPGSVMGRFSHATVQILVETPPSKR